MHLTQNDTPLLSPNGKGDATLGRRFAMHERKIAFSDLPLFHGERKTVRAKGVSRNEDGTARFSVKACDGAKDEGNISVKIGEGVCQRVLKMAVRRVGRHARWLFRDGHRLVFIKKTHGNGTREDGVVAPFVLDGKREGVARR